MQLQECERFAAGRRLLCSVQPARTNFAVQHESAQLFTRWTLQFYWLLILSSDKCDRNCRLSLCASFYKVAARQPCWRTRHQKRTRNTSLCTEVIQLKSHCYVAVVVLVGLVLLLVAAQDSLQTAPCRPQARCITLYPVQYILLFNTSAKALVCVTSCSLLCVWLHARTQTRAPVQLPKQKQCADAVELICKTRS